MWLHGWRRGAPRHGARPRPLPSAQDMLSECERKAEGRLLRPRRRLATRGAAASPGAGRSGAAAAGAVLGGAVAATGAGAFRPAPRRPPAGCGLRGLPAGLPVVTGVGPPAHPGEGRGTRPTRGGGAAGAALARRRYARPAWTARRPTRRASLSPGRPAQAAATRPGSPAAPRRDASRSDRRRHRRAWSGRVIVASCHRQSPLNERGEHHHDSASTSTSTTSTPPSRPPSTRWPSTRSGGRVVVEQRRERSDCGHTVARVAPSARPA